MKTAVFILLIVIAALGYRLYISSKEDNAPIIVEANPVSVGIHLISATYGPNCGAKLGNATKALGNLCDGKDSCAYKIEVEKLGDPAAGCAKSFVADYECLPGKTQLRREIPAEAGMGSTVLFSCVEPTAQQAFSPAQSVAAPLPAPPAAAAVIDQIETGIDIELATYGLNCGGASGNATRDLSDACNGKGDCDYEIQVAKFGDPKPHCGKNFIVHYACAPGRIRFVKTIAGEAGLGKHLLLNCPARTAGPASLPDEAIAEAPSAGIDIKGATYGANCGGKPGNATVDLADVCNGKDSCDYEVDVAKLGDPKQGCGKDFTARYRCAPGRTIFSRKLPGEAGLGSHLLLDCKVPAVAPRLKEEH